MPSQQQTRLLAAIEAGAQLHEALRLPGMPNRHLVEEWLANPEFEQLYSDAQAKGEHRTSPEAVAAKTAKTAVTRADKKAERLAAEQKLQQNVLLQLHKGSTTPVIIASTPGFNAIKLAAWRKDPSFAAKWDAAKANGRVYRAPKMVLAPEPSAAEPAPAPPVELIDLPALHPEPITAPADRPAAFYMVAQADGAISPTRHLTAENAQRAAEELVRATAKPAYVLMGVMEVVPELAVVSTKAVQLL